MSATTLFLLSPKKSGQALVEFALVAPLIVMIMVAGVMVGLAMYQGNLSSEAIKEPSLHKQEMAGTPGAVSDSTLLGYTKDGATGLIPSEGAPLDKLSTIHLNDQVTLLSGSKKYTPPVGALLPGLSFTFSVSNAIQRNLLRPIDMGGATLRHDNDVQGRTPPWQLPGSELPTFGGCNQGSPINVSPAGARAITGASPTYLSSAHWVKSTTMDVSVVYDLAQQFAGECASQGAGVCAAENEMYQPKPDEYNYRTCSNNSCVTGFSNPPGAPGMKVTMRVNFDAAVVEQKEDGSDKKVLTPVSVKPPEITSSMVEGFTPDSGMYMDPSGTYIRPPGDFVASCTKIKQGECALSKAADRANELAAQLQEECEL